MATTSPAFAAAVHNCVECGNSFPDTDMMAFENAWVCASCKPRFVQKLKEGVAPAGTLQYAGFWIRFCAKFLDGIILYIANFALGLLIGMAMVGAGRGKAGVAGGVAGFIVGIAYAVYFNGAYGATPGKMVMKLKIVRPDGEPISYMRALGRYFSELLSSAILLIGYMMAGWDEQKRALHDRICDTRVVKR